MLTSACWPVSWHEIHVRVCCGLPKFIREPKVVADKKSDSDSININGYKLTPRAEIGVFASVCEWVNLVIPVLFALWAYKDKGVEGRGSSPATSGQLPPIQTLCCVAIWERNCDEGPPSGSPISLRSTTKPVENISVSKTNVAPFSTAVETRGAI